MLIYWELFSCLRRSSSLACKKPYPNEGLSSVTGHPFMPSYYGLISRGALNDIREVTVFCSDSYLVDHIISLKKFKFKRSNN